MLGAKKVTKDLYELKYIKTMLHTLFPRAEQIPMWVLMQRSKKNFVDFIALYDESTFVGFTYLITDGNITYVFYLAINNNLQSKGYGTQILNYIKEKYPNNNIILSIEDIDENAPNNEQRKKRKDFYIKNGYKPAGIKMTARGVIYETLINGKNCTVQEYYHLFKKFTGPLLFAFIKPKMI